MSVGRLASDFITLERIEKASQVAVYTTHVRPVALHSGLLQTIS